MKSGTGKSGDKAAAGPQVQAGVPPRARVLVLVGFMGAGKTTTGRVLARRLQWRFVDLDDVIVAREGRSIPEIFEQFGEAAFRKAETAALKAMLRQFEHSPPAVLALGGGAMAQAENARLLKDHGAPTIFLDAPVEELRRRCQRRRAARPLFQDENQFRQLYEARRPAYMTADTRVDTLGKSNSRVAAEVLKLMQSDRLNQTARGG
jgi:shikimate kinase